MVKRKNPKMKRLTAEEFLNEVAQAPHWALIINTEINEIELIVQHEVENPISYLGPSPIHTNPEVYDMFLEDLEKVAADSPNGTFGV